MNNDIFTCKVQSIDKQKITVVSYGGQTTHIFFEDLPYFANENSFSVGQMLKVKVRGKMLIPLFFKSNDRRNNDEVMNVRFRRRKMMSEFDISMLTRLLPTQVKREIERIREEKND